VIEIRPDFQDYLAYLKLAFIYLEQRKFELAESTLREYNSRITPLSRLYFPAFEAQFKQFRGHLEAARESYRDAVTQLRKAGQSPGADRILYVLASYAVIEGEIAGALEFARKVELQGDEGSALAMLEAAVGNRDAAEHALERTFRNSPWLGPLWIEERRITNEAWYAATRNDARGFLSAAARLPDYNDGPFLLAKARAHLNLKEYSAAEPLFRHALSTSRSAAAFAAQTRRLPLVELLCHFHLGQIGEAQGRREQAVKEYREFLSHFDGSATRLPQVAEARAALTRLQ